MTNTAARSAQDSPAPGGLAAIEAEIGGLLEEGTRELALLSSARELYDAAIEEAARGYAHPDPAEHERMVRSLREAAAHEHRPRLTRAEDRAAEAGRRYAERLAALRERAEASTAAVSEFEMARELDGRVRETIREDCMELPYPRLAHAMAEAIRVGDRSAMWAYSRYAERRLERDAGAETVGRHARAERLARTEVRTAVGAIRDALTSPHLRGVEERLGAGLELARGMGRPAALRRYAETSRRAWGSPDDYVRPDRG
jgi:hypothetical protein